MNVILAPCPACTFPVEGLTVYGGRWMCFLCKFLQQLESREAAVVCDGCEEIMEPGLLTTIEGRSLCPICCLTTEDLEEIDRWFEQEEN